MEYEMARHLFAGGPVTFPAGAVLLDAGVVGGERLAVAAFHPSCFGAGGALRPEVRAELLAALQG